MFVADPLDDLITQAELTRLDRLDGRGRPLNITEILTPKWKEFACELNFDDRGDTISLIEANNARATGCCQETLQRWLAGNSRSGPVTWRRLIDCMDHMGYRAHANDVRKIISSRPSKS